MSYVVKIWHVTHFIIGLSFYCLFARPYQHITFYCCKLTLGQSPFCSYISALGNSSSSHKLLRSPLLHCLHQYHSLFSLITPTYDTKIKHNIAASSLAHFPKGVCCQLHFPIAHFCFLELTPCCSYIFALCLFVRICQLNYNRFHRWDAVSLLFSVIWWVPRTVPDT